MSKVIFSKWREQPFRFMPVEKNAVIFARDIRANIFLKSSKKSNQWSKHICQKVVMKVFHVFSVYCAPRNHSMCNVSEQIEVQRQARMSAIRDLHRPFARYRITQGMIRVVV